MKVWQCSVCRYIYRGSVPPDKCPICNVGAKKFREIDEAAIPAKRGQHTVVKKKAAGISPLPSESRKQPKNPANDLDEKTLPDRIKNFLIKYHAHPVLVHTPNGILPAAVLFWVLSWIFDSQLLGKVAAINMICVIAALPLVIITGVFEWQKKYNTAMTMVFKLKIVSAVLTTLTSIISLVWYLLEPNLLKSPMAWLFILINLIMLAAAGVAGHIGGRLVFKD
jgi:rubredoxin/uncharacterized membrane protein